MTQLPAESVEPDTANLLDALAEGPPDGDEQWRRFVRALRMAAAESRGAIDPNRVRALLDHKVYPQRVGSFYHRARRAGLIASAGWNVSNDKASRNSGKPQRKYTWTGGDRDE